jgi:hypothetical protein
MVRDIGLHFKFERHDDLTCICYRESLLCNALADPERASFTASCYLGDTATSAGDRRSGLLQLRPRGHDQNTADWSTVSSQCCCLAGVSCPEVRACHSSPPWVALVRVLQQIQFRLRVLAYQHMHGTAPIYLADSLHQMTYLFCWCADAVCAGDSSFDSGWPGLPRCDGPPLELATVSDVICTVTRCVPSSAQDVLVLVIVPLMLVHKLPLLRAASTRLTL